MIKAIIFDVGGVLLGEKSGSHGIWEHMAHELGIELDTWIDAVDTNYAKSIERKINGEKAVRLIVSNLKMSPVKLKKCG